MAFTVTPTSGAGPFTFQAEILNSDSIDNVDYELTVLNDIGAGACPAPGTGIPFSPVSIESLLTGDPVTIPTINVPEGSCRVFTMIIRKLSNNVEIDTAVASIDNV